MMSTRALSRIISHTVRIPAPNRIVFRPILKAVVQQARIIEVVPALGESITEGSIASWSKNVGDHVAVDDVIVIVETDKVTVDIKSTNAGILVAKLADENVVVGAPLYELETSGTAAAIIIKAPVESAVSTPVSPQPVADTKSHGRVPSIKFLGKRSLIKHVGIVVPVVAAAPPQEAAPVQKFIPVAPAKVIKEGTGVDFSTLKGGAMFGRPALSQREMDSIENGGATY